MTWRHSFIRTFVEHDLPALGISIPSRAIERFWAMLAHYHGQTSNASELARSFGTSDLAVRRYLELLAAHPSDCYFWATHTGAELDLLVVRGGRRLGFEFKRTDTPRLTPSMRSALCDLSLDRLDVVHAGSQTFPLAEKVRALSFGQLREHLGPPRSSLARRRTGPP